MDESKNERRLCIGCREVFHILAFFRHVAYTKSCKDAYGDEWPKMLKEKKKLANKRSYEKNKDKLKVKYHENKNVEKSIQINKQRKEKRKKEKEEKLAKHKKYEKERQEDRARAREKMLRNKAKKTSSKENVSATNDDASNAIEDNDLACDEKHVEDKISDERDDNNEKFSASESDDDSERYKREPKQCEGCRETFEFKTFLNHVTHKKSCKEKYGAERLKAMKESHRTAVWKHYEKNDRDMKWRVTKEILTENHGSLEVPRESGYIQECKGCNENFTYDTLFYHVSHSKKCLKAYGEEEWNEMSKKRRSYVVKNSTKRSKKLKKPTPQEERISRYDFQKELKDLERSTESEITTASFKLINPLLGGIWYYKQINRINFYQHPQILSLVKGLESDYDGLQDLKKKLRERLEKLMSTISKMPEFDTFVEGCDGHKDIQKKFDDFITEAREEWSRIKNIVGERFEIVERLLDIKHATWDEHYKQFYWNALNLGDRDEVYRSSEFRKHCKIAENIPEYLKTNPTHTFLSNKINAKTEKLNKQTESEEPNPKEDSPKITQKPFLHKRKKIDFNMSDLENAAEDENDSDFDN